MIAIFRHGETVYNTKSRLQGWCNSPLTDIGKNQVKTSAKHYLKHYHNCNLETHLYTSNLGRSLESGLIFAKIVNVNAMFSVDSLREINYGLLDGLRPIDNRVKKWLSDRQDNLFNFPAPNGESRADLYERVSLFLDQARIRYDNPDLINIFHVHDNVMKVLKGIFGNLHHDVWNNLPSPQQNYYIIDRINRFEVQPC